MGASARPYRRAFLRSGIGLLAAAAARDVIAAADDVTAVNASKQRFLRSVARNDIATVKLFAQEPFAARAATDSGRTALMVAAKLGDKQLTQVLLSAGADPNARTQSGGSALMFAAIDGHLEILRMLLAAGAELDAYGQNGWTALTIAAAKGRAAAIDLLLSEGSDPNHPDVFGFTPLMRALDHGYETAAAQLIAEERLDVQAQNFDGESALDFAVARRLVDAERQLRERGAR